MPRLRSTKGWIKYWQEREIDWDKDYLRSWDHPHRNLIVAILSQFKFASLMELGCASGPNLVRIRKQWPSLQVGGTDVSKEAIALAKKTIPNGIFDTASADEIFFSDNSVDVGLTDMTCIYLDKKRLKKTLAKMKKVVRKHVVFCEFHHKSWIKRLGLKLFTGYNAYDWVKLLEKEGFYDVEKIKITEDFWPGGEPQKTFGYIITATVPPLV